MKNRRRDIYACNYCDKKFLHARSDFTHFTWNNSTRKRIQEYLIQYISKYISQTLFLDLFARFSHFLYIDETVTFAITRKNAHLRTK